MTDACKTPMADHIAEFWRLLETEHVRVLVDIRRDHEPDSGVSHHWDSASFPNETAKAIAADHRAHPEYLTGCQLHGPGECQSYGQCLSSACNNHGKVIVKRLCIEPKEVGILYPRIENAGGEQS